MSHVSDVQICNMALAHCGISLLIADLAEKSNQAELCSLFYASTRDKVLQAFPWPFACTCAPLQDLGNPPANWGFRYLYPTDCLKFRNIVASGCVPLSPGIRPGYSADSAPCTPPRAPFRVGLAADGSCKVIYTDVSGAQGEYTVMVTDPTLFPRTFVNALAWALATELAVPLTTDMQRAQLAQTKYLAALLEAGADLLNENEDGPQPESDFIRCRR